MRINNIKIIVNYIINGNKGTISSQHKRMDKNRF